MSVEKETKHIRHITDTGSGCSGWKYFSLCRMPWHRGQRNRQGQFPSLGITILIANIKHRGWGFLFMAR